MPAAPTNSMPHDRPKHSLSRRAFLAGAAMARALAQKGEAPVGPPLSTRLTQVSRLVPAACYARFQVVRSSSSLAATASQSM